MEGKLNKIWINVRKILAITLILGFVSCAKEEKTTGGGTTGGETIKIGVIVPLTGDLASF
jgi:hypothetical protein